MFIYSRRTGESLCLFPALVQPTVDEVHLVPTLAGLVKVTVVAVEGNRVTFAVTGPEGLSVRREEDIGPAR